MYYISCAIHGLVRIWNGPQRKGRSLLSPDNSLSDQRAAEWYARLYRTIRTNFESLAWLESPLEYKIKMFRLLWYPKDQMQTWNCSRTWEFYEEDGFTISIKLDLAVSFPASKKYVLFNILARVYVSLFASQRTFWFYFFLIKLIRLRTLIRRFATTAVLLIWHCLFCFKVCAIEISLT